jgi:hypothetical protein
MPIESNEAEDNEERDGDFYSHVHTLVLSAGSAHCGMESFGPSSRASKGVQ